MITTDKLQYTENSMPTGPSFAMLTTEEVLVDCRVHFNYTKELHDKGHTHTRNVIKILELVGQQLVIQNPKFDKKEVNQAIHSLCEGFNHYEKRVDTPKFQAKMTESASRLSLMGTAGLELRYPTQTGSRGNPFNLKGSTPKKTALEIKYSFLDIQLTKEEMEELDEHMKLYYEF